jgi:predicted nucleic acid-binding protein
MTSSPAPWSLDSNIFVYAMDEADPVKKLTAQTLWQKHRLGGHMVVAQVLGEVFRLLRSPRFGATGAAARMAIQDMQNHARVVSASPAAFDAALNESARTNRQFWDCLIIATCAEHGVKTLYTEDTAGQPHTVMGVKLVNPFI